MDGWIKLHRKCLDNKVFMHDPTAWRVFEYLLLIVDHKSGSRDIGRFQLSAALDIPSGTIYSALKRLQNAKMVNIKSNNKYSVISISNWSEYQEGVNTSVNNNSTTTQQQLNTKQELRIKKEEGNKNFCATALRVADDLGVEPTIGLHKFVDKHNMYFYEDFTICFLAKCEENKGKKGYNPTIATWLNWARRDIESGRMTKK